jgi:hypothetical protein
VQPWEKQPESVPAQSDGVFVQFSSPTAQKVVYVPFQKGKAKDSSDVVVGDEVELNYSDFEIIPSPFAKSQ